MNQLSTLKRMFNPNAIAVIGASREPGKVGYAVVKNVIEGGYKGKVYPVNPRADEILGIKCYHNVVEISETIDVAILCVPALIIPRILEDLGKKRVPIAIVISSGFAEVGNRALHQELIIAAKQAKVRVLGPNIFGYYYTPNNLCATFCIPYTKKGGIALTCQSGGVGMGVIGYTRSHEIGVSAIVGLGNKADLDESDFLEFFAQDEFTSVIALHMEGLKDGKRFLQVAQKVAKIKPIIAFKVGRTTNGARAAASHTAALAGKDHLYEAAFKQSGVLRARTLEELFDWAKVLAKLSPPTGDNVVIHTGAGGLGVILSDACYDRGLKLMRIPRDLEQKLRKYIPPFGSFRNPIDITGASPPHIYEETARLLINDDRVNSIIFGYWQTVITPPMEFATALARVVHETQQQGGSKPVVASLSGDSEVERAAKYLEKQGIPSYPYTPEKAVAGLSALYNWTKTTASRVNGEGVQCVRKYDK